MELFLGELHLIEHASEVNLKLASCLMLRVYLYIKSALPSVHFQSLILSNHKPQSLHHNLDHLTTIMPKGGGDKHAMSGSDASRIQSTQVNPLTIHLTRF